MRKLAVGLALLLVVLLVADRVAASIAAGAVAARLQQSGALRSEPSVSIRGFPFLTQALAGRYAEIDVTARSVSRGGVRVSRLDATIVGARIGVSAALKGSVSAVPVERLHATALVSYADLATASDLPGAVVASVKGGVRVSGRVTVLGKSVRASTVSTVRLSGEDIVVTARSVSVEGGSSAAVVAALAHLLDLRVRVGRLPYGLELDGVRATGAGLLLTASSGPTVLTVHP